MTMRLEAFPMLFSSLALGAAGVALTLACTVPPPPPPTVDLDAFEALRAEQVRLGQELQKLNTEVAERSMQTPEPARQPARQELTAPTPQLTRQVEAIAARLEKLEKKTQATARTADLPILAHLMEPRPKLTPEQRQQKVSELRAEAMDGTQMDILRIVALQQLRSLGKGARTGDVAQSMIYLAQGTEDPEIRAHVWRNMHRADDKQLIDPMIQALSHDTDTRVREEAAESLGFFLDVPRAKAALEHAMRNDATRGVRREAERSLEGKNR
ncbi:MAG: HEAT repeat domain-containing protein [Planctomycetota bacterium]